MDKFLSNLAETYTNMGHTNLGIFVKGQEVKFRFFWELLRGWGEGLPRKGF